MAAASRVCWLYHLLLKTLTFAHSCIIGTRWRRIRARHGGTLAYAYRSIFALCIARAARIASLRIFAHSETLHWRAA